ncbi:hypothetical protein HDU76_000217 [Blyttiomyces sp. JEL0837]|nr:hypothetical protein HDU76_000217 [Blyttiomyces sp. JEL0837]
MKSVMIGAVDGVSNVVGNAVTAATVSAAAASMASSNSITSSTSTTSSTTNLAIGVGTVAVAAAAAMAAVGGGFDAVVNGVVGAFNSNDDALAGIGRDRFEDLGEGVSGLPLGTGASAVAGFRILKRLKVFRERGFVLEKPGDPSLPTVITVDGFCQDGSESRNWTKIIEAAFPNHTWLSLQWDASSSWTLETASKFLTTTTLSPSSSPSSTSNSTATLTSFLTTTATTTISGYQESQKISRDSGYLLADSLSRLDLHKSVILLGHSLGAGVILHAIKVLEKSGRLVMGGFEREMEKVRRGRERRVDVDTNGESLNRYLLTKGDERDQLVKELVERYRNPVIEGVFLLGCVDPGVSDTDVGGDFDNIDCTTELKCVKNHLVNFYSKRDCLVSMLGGSGVSLYNGDVGDSSYKNRGYGGGRLLNVECDEVFDHFEWRRGVAVGRFLQEVQGWECYRRRDPALEDARQLRYGFGGGLD